MSDRPERDLNRYIVRFPEGMRDRIADAAKANGRSMNAEIVHRLEQSFAGDLGRDVEELRRMMAEVKVRVAEILASTEPDEARNAKHNLKS